MSGARNPAETFGVYIARGVLKEIVRWAIVIAIATALLNWLADHLGVTVWDSTDNRAAYEHSNLKPLIDHATGCQYLETKDGAIAARMGADGRQICVPK